MKDDCDATWGELAQAYKQIQALENESKLAASAVAKLTEEFNKLQSENAELREDKKRLERLMTLERGDLLWFHQEQDKRRALDILMEDEE